MRAITPVLVRQFMDGQITLDALPNLLRGQIATIARRLQRQAARAHQRDFRAFAYRKAALAGGGKREVARRLRQIERGSLRVLA